MLKPRIKESVWNPSFEKDVLKKWEKKKLFRFDLKTKKKIFAIDTPPPYPKSL